MDLGSLSTSTQGSRNRKESVVYVVDDDEAMRLALGELLRPVGLHVETFESSQDFLAFPKADAPGCLVLDVRLRGERRPCLSRTDCKERSVHADRVHDRAWRYCNDSQCHEGRCGRFLREAVTR